MVQMSQVPGASGVVGVAAATGTAEAVGARSIDFTLDGKEGLFQVPHHTVLRVFGGQSGSVRSVVFRSIFGLNGSACGPTLMLKYAIILCKACLGAGLLGCVASYISVFDIVSALFLQR